jgi:ABC-type transport system substrate-binding protein
MYRRALAILLALTMILPPFFASGQAQENELVLRVAMQDDMKGTNPITVSDVWSWDVLQWIYERPILADYDSKKLMPYIAIGSANLSGKTGSWSDCDIGNFGYSPQSDWANSSKQEAIVFYDFNNVKWHDGHQMDIRDIMFSFHFAGQVPEWSSSVDCLKDKTGNAGSNYSKTSWLHVYPVWEDGNKAALKFVLQDPYSGFFENTISTLLLPYHIWGSTISGQNVNETKIWCDTGYNLSTTSSWKVAAAQSYENDPPIGCGIFKFEFWEKGQMSKLSTYREHFYGANYAYKSFIMSNFPNQNVKQPQIDAITFQIFKTAEAAVLAIKGGDIDYIAWSIPPTFTSELANEPGIVLYSAPEDGFFYLSYNMRRTSFGYQDGDPAKGDVGKPLRQAIAHCIDKNKIINRLLLNLGIPGSGPVNPLSPYYNSSVPKYDFNLEKAKRILADAGYKVNVSGVLLSGDDAFAAANSVNYWVNPDGSPIGSGLGGQIMILTPQANYDPVRAQAGLWITQSLRDIGINAKTTSLGFGDMYDFIEQRNFDICIFGWRIFSEPVDYLHAFFHSSNSRYGQNNPGYQNKSFDALIELARTTGDESVRKKAIFDAQAAICYDLPYDVLYYRKNVIAVRSDYLIGWVEHNGDVFNRDSIVNLRGPYPHKLYAVFNKPISAVYSNSTTPLSVLVRGDDGSPMENTSVAMNASIGSLSPVNGITNIGGQFSTSFIAPYVPPTPDNIRNGTMAFIQITSATCDSWGYSPAPPRYILVWVYPEEAKFISLSISADPDIIDDLGADRTTPGFTNVVVEVTDQGGLKVPGARVNLSSSSSAIVISPFEALADQDGKATFRVAAANLSNDDGSVSEFVLTAQASTTGATIFKAQNHLTIQVLDVSSAPIAPQSTAFPGPMVFVAAFMLAAVAFAVIIRRKRP